MRATPLAAILILGLGTTSFAQDEQTAGDLSKRMIERRAVEAVVWGMPAVNYDLMLQEMLKKTPGKVNQVIYWGRPLDWHNQTLTPNPDTLYFMAFLDTRDVGPIVIEVPPAGAAGSLNANIVNVWQEPLEDAGLLGIDKGAGIRFLMLPPGFRNPVPDGYTALRPRTNGSYALLRSSLASHADADVARAAAYGQDDQGLSPVPGREPAAHRVHRCEGRAVRLDHPLRRDFFEGLDRIVQTEPWFDRDRVMIDLLKTLGIEKGKPFAPDRRDPAGARRGRARGAGTAGRPLRCGPAAVLRGHALDLPGACRTRPGRSRRFREPGPISGRCARARVPLRLHRHQAARRRAVLPALAEGQERRAITTAARPIASPCRRTRRSSSTGR